jgi:hypothetical protein
VPNLSITIRNFFIAVQEPSSQIELRATTLYTRRRRGIVCEQQVAVSARIMNERQGVPRLRENVRLVSRGAHESSSEISDFERGS